MSGTAGLTIGTLADSVTTSFSDLSKLITASSYLAGLGFSTAAILKFKAHKDNPTQLPIGTPSALTVLAAIELYLPTLEAKASAAGVSVSDVKAAAEKAGITQAKVEAQATAAGATPAQISAAESALKAKLPK